MIPEIHDVDFREDVMQILSEDCRSENYWREDSDIADLSIQDEWRMAEDEWRKSWKKIIY